MTYRKESLGEVLRKHVFKNEVPEFLSRRVFHNHPSQSIMSIDAPWFSHDVYGAGQMHERTDVMFYFTNELHNIPNKTKTEKVYNFVNSSRGPIKADTGLFVYAHPGVVTGIVGRVSPLVFETPGFTDTVDVVETLNFNDKKWAIAKRAGYDFGVSAGAEFNGDREFLRTRRTAPKLEEDIWNAPICRKTNQVFELNAENPAVSFIDAYDVLGLGTVLAHHDDYGVFGVVKEINDINGLMNFKSPTYLHINSGEGKVEMDLGNIVAEKGDLFLIDGERFKLKGNMAVTMMVKNPSKILIGK